MSFVKTLLPLLLAVAACGNHQTRINASCKKLILDAYNSCQHAPGDSSGNVDYCTASITALTACEELCGAATDCRDNGLPLSLNGQFLLKSKTESTARQIRIKRLPANTELISISGVSLLNIQGSVFVPGQIRGDGDLFTIYQIARTRNKECSAIGFSVISSTDVKKCNTMPISLRRFEIGNVCNLNDSFFDTPQEVSTYSEDGTLEDSADQAKCPRENLD